MRMAATITMHRQHKHYSNCNKIIVMIYASTQFLLFIFKAAHLCPRLSWPHIQLFVYCVLSTYVSLDDDGCSLAPLGLPLQLPSVQELFELEKGDEVSSLRKHDTGESFAEAPLEPFVSPCKPSSSSAAPWQPCASWEKLSCKQSVWGNK